MKRSEPLPKNLELTPERRQKIEEQQKLLREQALSRGRLNAEARRMQLALAHETAALSDVQMLLSEGHKVQTSEPLRLALNKLAEALALQGRYDEAGKRAVGELKQHYFQLWQAVWRDDEATCPCEPFQEGELSLTHDHVAEEVLSLKHNKIMPAIRCNHCGFVNVRPLTPELQRLEQARAEAARLHFGHSAESLRLQPVDHRSALSDQQLLKKR